MYVSMVSVESWSTHPEGKGMTIVWHLGISIRDKFIKNQWIYPARAPMYRGFKESEADIKADWRRSGRKNVSI